MKQKREIIVNGATATIPLTRGYEAVIDAKDVPLVDGYNWFAVVQDYTVYAVRRVSGVVGKGSKVSLHRHICGPKDDEQIDHIDLNGLNNVRSNLRFVTPAQNCWNRRTNSRNTSGYKGVCWNKKCNKWQAGIKVHGLKKHLGLFDDPKEAYDAYCQAAKDAHGEFARVV